MTPLDQFSDIDHDNGTQLTESFGPTAIRAGGLALLAKIAGLNSEVQADRSATTADKKLSSELMRLAGLVSGAVDSVTGDEKKR